MSSCGSSIEANSGAEREALRTDDFDFDLPAELIAQTPAEPRDTARLLVLNRESGRLDHRVFRELDQLLQPGDLLIGNRSRVWPARLVGRRSDSGGRVGALLLRQAESGDGDWEALVRPGRRLQPGTRVVFERAGRSVEVEIRARLASGGRLLRVLGPTGNSNLLDVGETPLPPYIHGWSGDPERYQTIYGDRPGSAAAPTAGLHFTSELLDRLMRRGIGFDFVTLHVGTDTFRPIRATMVDEHEMHAEWAEVPPAVLARVAETRARGGKVIAVGTTAVRGLESAAVAAAGDGWSGWTRLFIRPGHRFLLVDALITNFHLPRSSLLLLVSALVGRESILSAYREAISRRYRFYSFGDAMLLC
jgi:S-adenosylmethionine:tRNA ribosyltransferase-isomerase